tara:strand:+ start:9591 stop:10010 length:420 start_codon:yes stop_codon:yes gene_type:complete
MNLKRATVIGLIIWVLTFLLGILLLAIIGFENVDSLENNVTFSVVGIAIIVLLAAWGSVRYFNGKNVKRNAKEGFLLGLTFLIVGSILDALSAIPFVYTGGELSELTKYYATPLFAVSVVFLLLTTTIVGNLMKKRKKR